MLAVTGDVAVVAVGGVVAALITAAFAFAGVLVSVRTQKTPSVVEVDPAIDVLRAQLANAELRLLEAAVDRDHWRDVARALMPPRPPAAD